MNLHRRDPEQRMARFYRIALQLDLLEGWAVLREWGRIGQAGRVRADVHGDLGKAEASARAWADRKRRRGYLTAKATHQPASAVRNT